MSELNAELIRPLSPKHLAGYLLEIKKTHSVEQITKFLFESIYHGSISPIVISVWLPVSRDASVIQYALGQFGSMNSRTFAIKRLGRALQQPDWKETWDVLGGVPGFLRIFAEASVTEVKQLAAVLGRCHRACEQDEAKDAAITELFKALIPSVYPDAAYKMSDDRPLLEYFVAILPACSGDVVREVLVDHLHPLSSFISLKLLVGRHYDLIRDLALSKLFKPNTGVGSDNGPQQSNFHVKSGVLQTWIEELTQYIPRSLPPEPGFRSAIGFPYLLVSRLADPSVTYIGSFDVIHGFTSRVLSRAYKRKRDLNAFKDLVDLLLNYWSANISKNTVTVERLIEDKIIRHIVNCWAMNQTLFEDQLIRATEMANIKSLSLLSHMPYWLQRVNPADRYKLMKLLFIHSASKTNVEVVDELKALLKKSHSWPLSLFLESLPNPDALDLFRKLMTACPDERFLSFFRGVSILNHPISLEERQPEPSLLRAYLERGYPGALECAIEETEEFRKKSVRSREQEARAHYAQSANAMAIASGSLDLYIETLTWSRRFLRDPLTVKKLFSQAITSTVEGVELLSVTNTSTGNHQYAQELTLEELESNLAKANSILTTYFDFAITALREPSFQAYDWTAILTLFGEVVASRVQKADEVQKFFKLSDEQMHEKYWASTIDLLIEAEKKGLQPDYEKLGFSAIGGPLKYQTGGRVIKKEFAISSLFFLDEYARKRDQLWQNFRPSVYPEVVTLPPPWPRGLPIQSLIPYRDIKPLDAFKYMPFISARAKAVFYHKPDVLLGTFPRNSETKVAIGPFVDSFETALRVLINQDLDLEVRLKTTSELWEHAVGPLSAPRMSSEEASRFWKWQFGQAMPEFQPPTQESESQNINYPVVPQAEDADETMEWNPAMGEPKAIPSRSLAGTCLDACLNISDNSFDKIYSKFRIPSANISGVTGFTIWSDYSITAAVRNPALQDGLILSALLYLENKMLGTSGLLASPFPSVDDIRYPSIFLDTDFLARKDVYENGAYHVISSFRKTIPPPLLVKFTEKALKKLENLSPTATSVALVERCAYNMLSFLSRSDDPRVAITLAVQSMFNHPAGSSWHRKILAKGLLRKLPKTSVDMVFHSFAENMTRIQEARKVATAAAGSEAAANAPFIKITTIKYLAQLSQDAQYVSPMAAVNFLIEVFKSSTHIDVRIAVITALIEKLSYGVGDDSESMQSTIISALEMTIPVISGLNERSAPISEESWTEHRENGWIHGISKFKWTEIPPILLQFCSAVANRYIPAKCRLDIMNRILLPVIESSIAINARWMRDCAVHYGFVDVLEKSELEVFPVYPQVLDFLLKNCASLVPSRLLSLYHRYLMLNLFPTPQTLEITKIAKDEMLKEKTRNSKQLSHWLVHYDRGSKVFWDSNIKLATWLGTDWESERYDGIQVAQIQELLLEQVKASLKLGQHTFSLFSYLTAPLKVPTTLSRANQDTWTKYARPVAVDIIHMIDDIRTPEWQRNPERSPPFLPRTFPLHLWFLSYPSMALKGESRTTFTGEIEQILRNDILPNLTSSVEYEELISAIGTQSRERKITLAWDLDKKANVDESMETFDYLLVQVVERLLNTSFNNKAAVPKKYKDIVMRWLASPVERIRMKAVVMELAMRPVVKAYGIED